MLNHILGHNIALRNILICSLLWPSALIAEADCITKTYFESEEGVLTEEEQVMLLDKQFIVSLSNKVECDNAASNSSGEGSTAEATAGGQEKAQGGNASRNRLQEGESSTALDGDLIPRESKAADGFDSSTAEQQQGSNGKQEEELLAADNDLELRRQIQELIKNEKNEKVKEQLQKRLKEL